MSPKNTKTLDPAASISVLHDLTQTFGGRVTKKKVMLMGGIVLTQQLRALYRDHRIELLANDDFMLADVEANYGPFELLKINPTITRPYRNIVRTTKTNHHHLALTVEGDLSPAQSKLVESGALQNIAQIIDLQTNEEMNVSQRLVRAYMRRPDKNRVLNFVQAVIDLMPHKKGGEILISESTLPEALRPLVPLISRWAISDDAERTQKLKRCAESTRKKLTDTVILLLPVIDKFLDSFGMNPPEEVCVLGDLAQTALEAKSLLPIKN